LPFVKDLILKLPAMRFVLAATLLTACSGGGQAPLPTSAPASLSGAAKSLAPAAPAVGPSGFSAMRAVFEHSLVCDNGILIAQYAQKYGIATLFVPVAGDDLGSLLAGNPTTVKNLNAMLDVANVYVVTGTDAWVNSPTSVPSDVTSLISIAAKFPRLSGVLYAIDPEDLPQWKSEQKTAIANYFTLVVTLEKAQGASNFKKTLFTTDLDFATISSGEKSGSTMLERLQNLAGTSGVTTLVPGNSATEQFAAIKSSLPQYTKPFRIEASTSKYGKSTYYGVTAQYLKTNLTTLQSEISKKNSLLASIEVNGWNDLFNSLNSVLPQPPTFNGKLAPGPLVPPSGTTYLGGYINPSGQGQTATQTAQFEQQIGRPLAFNIHFYTWLQTFPSSGGQEYDDVANGRIPIETWNCGDTDANIIAGKDDALIAAEAQAFKAFNHPMFLRWFWEMNLNDLNDPPRTACWDKNTDLPNGYFSPQEYIAAWDHVRSIFVAQGATNVIWEWCVAFAHGGAAQYYPGDSEVDWVAMDDYDTADNPLEQTFYYLASSLSQFQEKPFMINETGAHAANQPAYFTGAAATLQNDFPAVRALGYYDSVGTFQNWVLTGPGLSAFTTFANDPYMSAFSQNPQRSRKSLR
jgi:hypothetical protein